LIKSYIKNYNTEVSADTIKPKQVVQLKVANLTNFNPSYVAKRQIPTKKNMPKVTLGKTGLNFYGDLTQVSNQRETSFLNVT
jgi:hypothetical protein